MSVSTGATATVFAVVALACSGCATRSDNGNSPDQSQERLVRVNQDGDDYVECVASHARFYANDANSDADAPEDIATASLAHCDFILSHYRSDFVTEVKSNWHGWFAPQPAVLAHLDYKADELVADVKALARDGAVTLVIDTRRKRSTSRGGGSPSAATAVTSEKFNCAQQDKALARLATEKGYQYKPACN